MLVRSGMLLRLLGEGEDDDVVVPLLLRNFLGSGTGLFRGGGESVPAGNLEKFGFFSIRLSMLELMSEGESVMAGFGLKDFPSRLSKFLLDFRGRGTGLSLHVPTESLSILTR